jgi:hypothetical protein
VTNEDLQHHGNPTHLEGSDGADARGKHLGGGGVSAAATVHDLLKMLGEVIAEVGGHNGGGGLAGAETEVIAGGGDGHAHQVSVLVDGGDDGRDNDVESIGVAAGLGDLVRVEEVDAIEGGERPVVVLACHEKSEKVFGYRGLEYVSC